MLYVPGTVAVLDASVSVDVSVLPVSVGGASVAVTPAGAPVAVSAMSPVKPPWRAIVIVLVPPAPASDVTVAGAAASVKPGVAAALIVSAIVCVCCSDASSARGDRDVVRARSLAFAPAVKVSVVAVTPPPSGDAGLSVAVTPVGRPQIAIATSPVNPLCARC